MNNNKHFEFTDETINVGLHVLHRIRATKDIPIHGVDKGDLGGFVESYDNLSDHAWVCGNAKVHGNARVSGDAWIQGDAVVFGNARVLGNAEVFGNAKVSEDAQIFGNAKVFDDAKVFGNAQVFGDAKVYEDAAVSGYAEVCEDARVFGDAVVTSDRDYIVFKNFWSSGRYFTWTRSNNMWSVGCFYGTGEELIAKAYRDSEKSGKQYKRVVDYINELLKEEE